MGTRLQGTTGSSRHLQEMKSHCSLSFLHVCVYVHEMSWKRPPAALGHDSEDATDLLSQGLWKKPRLNFQSPELRRPLVTGNSGADNVSEGLWKKPRLSCDSATNSWQTPPLNVNGFSSCVSKQPAWKQPSLSLDVEATCDMVRKVYCQHHEISLDSGMLGLLVPSDAPESVYTANAKDPARIASALTAGCPCRSSCFQDMKTKVVEEIADLWHSLSEEQQTQYLQGQWVGPTMAETAEAASRRTKWRLAGKSVCLRGLASLLGTAERTLQKRVKGVLDMRRNHMQYGSLCRQTPKQQAIIDLFFSELYHSVAEDLPEKQCTESADEFVESIEDAFFWTPEASLAQNVVALQTPTGHKDEYEHCLLGALSCSSCSSKPGGQPTKQCCKGVAQHRARFALKCQAGQLGGGFGSTNGVLS